MDQWRNVLTVDRGRSGVIVVEVEAMQVDESDRPALWVSAMVVSSSARRGARWHR
jgi:hypothetical protein